MVWFLCRRSAVVMFVAVWAAWIVIMAETNTDKIDVAYVARLARLQLTDEEAALFQSQLEHIVAYVDKIGELDLADIEPTSHAHPVLNVFRKDEVRPGLSHDEVMANAPVHTSGQFIVPKIVE